jgi:hypothetical protein
MKQVGNSFSWCVSLCIAVYLIASRRLLLGLVLFISVLSCSVIILTCYIPYSNFLFYEPTQLFKSIENNEWKKFEFF